MREKHDTVIIGGGQAGLAMSYHLSQRRREHLVLERRRIAERWRTERWDSLRFQLPNWALDLPGKAYEVFRSGRRVLLAISRHVRVPRRYRGKDLIWWYENLGREK